MILQLRLMRMVAYPQAEKFKPNQTVFFVNLSFLKLTQHLLAVIGFFTLKHTTNETKTLCHAHKRFVDNSEQMTLSAVVIVLTLKEPTHETKIAFNAEPRGTFVKLAYS